MTAGGTGLPVAAALGVDAGWLTELVDRCRRRGVTVATAESLTAGLVCAALTEVPGASSVIRGGIVCYATDLKDSLVGVDQALLAAVGPVHPEVARALAAGARARAGADIGIGLTGVAGPDPQDGHPPGTVFVALRGPDTDRVERLPSPAAGDHVTRSGWRSRAVRLALRLLADEVGERRPPPRPREDSTAPRR